MAVRTGPVAGAGGARLRSLTGAEPSAYRAHPLHSPERSYQETNCYTDVLIELLHARGLEPLAMLGHLVRMDFEGDQWTFFKPPPEDLEALFAVDIHEMQPYRPIPLQIEEQLARDRTLIVELDAWFLPDTAATSYRSAHVKTSIAADAIDREREVLRYFHNTGLHELSGDDYRGAFGLDPYPPVVLPPYTEIARFDSGSPATGDALRAEARRILAHHLAHRPRRNPFESFGEALERALPELLAGTLDDYHAYAFATVRMCGAAFELLASHVAWVLEGSAQGPLGAMDEIVERCKTLSFRLARRKAFDPRPALEAAAAAWAQTMSGLEESVA